MSQNFEFAGAAPPGVWQLRTAGVPGVPRVYQGMKCITLRDAETVDPTGGFEVT